MADRESPKDPGVFERVKRRAQEKREVLNQQATARRAAEMQEVARQLAARKGPHAATDSNPESGEAPPSPDRKDDTA